MNQATKWVLESLLFVYGEKGVKYTQGNHNVLTWLLTGKLPEGEDDLTDVTPDCARAIGRALKAYPVKNYLISEWEKRVTP